MTTDSFIGMRLSSGTIFAVFDGCDLSRHCVHYIDDQIDLEFKYRKEARKIMNVCRLVCFHDHVAAVIANPDHKPAPGFQQSGTALAGQGCAVEAIAEAAGRGAYFV